MEVESAANFIIHWIKIGDLPFCDEQYDTLRQEIISVLCHYYKNHWFPEKPHKGSGYRKIFIDYYTHPFLVEAFENAHISLCMVRSKCPYGLTLFVDPSEVYYQWGDYSTIWPLFTEDSEKPWTPLKRPGAPIPPAGTFTEASDK